MDKKPIKIPPYKPPRRDRRARPTQAVLDRAKFYLDHHEVFEHDLPTMPGLAGAIGVPVSILIEWRGLTDEKSVDFAEICDMIEDKMHHVLLHDGSQGLLAQPTATLALQSIFKYRKNEQISGPEEGPIRVSLDLTPEQAQQDYRKIMRRS